MGDVRNGEVRNMNAYSETMMRLSDARLAELYREAEQQRLAASVAGPRRWGWRRRAQVVVDGAGVADVSPLPAPDVFDMPLPRSA